MTEAATAEKEEKEADHHPYFRPKDAATLILIDRSGDKPKVLVVMEGNKRMGIKIKAKEGKADEEGGKKLLPRGHQQRQSPSPGSFDEQEEWAKITEIMASLCGDHPVLPAFRVEKEVLLFSHVGGGGGRDVGDGGGEEVAALGRWLASLDLPRDLLPRFLADGFDDIHFLVSPVPLLR